MKKVLSLLLSFTLLVTMIPATVATGFADVDSGAWYAEAVDYVVNHKLMSGYSASEFAPNDALSRAMVVQVLYNREGQPAQSGSHGFNDVKAGDWFNNAVTWGTKWGVMSGYGEGKFAPNDNVTIEQIAVILWNYAGKPAFSASADSVGTHSSWAANGLGWAVENGILDKVPYDAVTEGATRAQTAQMLANFFSGKAAPAVVTGITLDITSHKMGEDWTQYLTATLSPAGAKDTITWTSSNPKAATVNEKGKVSGVAGGETIITATTSNGLTATCKVEVWHSHKLVGVNTQYKGTVEYYACNCGHSYENWIPREFKKYTYRGFTLSVPVEYVNKLIVQKGDGKPWVEGKVSIECLFDLSEKASWEAGKKAFGYEGQGYLVGIYRVNDAGVAFFLAGTGCEILARDAKGYYYIADRPTDVQFWRTDISDYGGEIYHPDWESWCELDHWAASVVTKEFVEEHAGLRKVLDIDMELGRWYDDIWRYLDEELGERWDKPEYLIQKSDEKTAHVSNGTKSDTYLEKLGRDVTFTRIEDKSFTPSGPWISFRVRDASYGTIYDVFTGTGEQHIIRRRPSRYVYDYDAGYYTQTQYYTEKDWEYYTVTKNGKPFNAGKVVTDWWNAVKK